MKAITVIGGGLAGLTLGIGLRQRGVPVAIWEVGDYPRHRVCGEFISGRGLEVLCRLGLARILEGSGARWAHTARFAGGRTPSITRQLPKPALCLSRFILDALLAEQFQRRGGELRLGARWPMAGDTPAEVGVVYASGRRLRAVEDGWRWFGLKAHAREVALEADLEMHFSPGGYVGLTRLNRDEVNVCGLFRRRLHSREGASGPWELLRGPVDSLLRERLAHTVFDASSFCAVAGLSLRPQRASGECRIGDALTMIAPVTGNGMSMAFEAAELAAAPLEAYSRGQIAWAEARGRIARSCDRAFRRRLAWARWLQGLLFIPAFQNHGIRWVLRSEPLWRLLFERTR